MCNRQQNIEQLQTPTMGVIINNESTTTEPLPQNGQLLKPPGDGGLNAFHWYQIFALDSAVGEVQKMFSPHGCLLTIAMYHSGETLPECHLILLLKFYSVLYTPTHIFGVAPYKRQSGPQMLPLNIY